jgi:thimet oligopeptidase
MESTHSPPIFEGASEPQPLAEDGEFSYEFGNITSEDLRRLADETIAKCDVFFDQILDSDQLTYDSVLAPFNEIDDILQQTFSFLETLAMLHPDPIIRRMASETSLAILRNSNEYIHNFDGNKRVRAYQDTDEASKLEGERKDYLECAIDWLDEGGYGLPRGKRQKLKKLQTSLQEFEEEFLQNIAEDTTTVVLSEVEVVGLDEQSKSAFLEDLGNGRYELKLVESTYTGFMSSASDREARRKTYQAYNSRVQEANTWLLQEAVYVRQKTAALLGYGSWTEFVGRCNMLKSPEEILELYNMMIPALTLKAQQEVAVMEEMLIADGCSGPLQIYDLEYYEARLFKEKYDVDLDKVREYLPLTAVLAGSFDLTGKLFGLSFRQQEAPGWHPGVLSFAVNDAQTARQLGTLYMDLFPREGKYKHCLCQPLVVGRVMPDGSYRRPSSLIIANLTPPVDGEPALLSQEQRVDVGFHEFGHALHSILTKAKLSAFSGSATEVDFVEIPSQIMENWAWDAQILQQHARHYKTGEPMPEAMIEALIDSKNLNAGIKYLQYINKGLFDLYLHHSLELVDVAQCWEKASEVLPFPSLEGSFYPAILEHVMSSYAGGYYSYIYDEIFSSDMFRRFQDEGLFNSETGQDYRQKILEPGGTREGSRMIKDFLGRKVDSAVFLRSLGIAAITEL